MQPGSLNVATYMNDFNTYRPGSRNPRSSCMRCWTSALSWTCAQLVVVSFEGSDVFQACHCNRLITVLRKCCRTTGIQSLWPDTPLFFLPMAQKERLNPREHATRSPTFAFFAVSFGCHIFSTFALAPFPLGSSQAPFEPKVAFKPHRTRQAS